jgi:hypothetical protein
MVSYCGFTHETVTNPIRRDPNCVCEHRRHRRVTGPKPISECTLKELVLAAGYFGSENFEGLSFNVGHMVFCEYGTCDCGERRPLMRFLEPRGDAGRCHACDAFVRPHPFYSHDPVPSGVVVDKMDAPLQKLGVTSTGWVTIRCPEGGVLIMNP